ncbi:acetyl-CoA synthetase-like protein [Crucibulum laeve]|uniref:Acetyl-CoA synthetase-like protein n=1 Tax=Crucibulum laeve TaxID=68775 RepID=A0A5C3M4U7_9AGAR|nr:acetyl-CoA synthetase-like protein [Crucibulum laeve]
MPVSKGFLSSPSSTQCLTSETFSPPPLDGSLTLPELYDWHLEHTKHRLFTYSNDDNYTESISWAQAVNAIHAGAVFIKDVLQWRQPEISPVVGIIALSDTLTYFSMIVGVMRANMIVFPISPRNSAAAIAYIISKTGIAHILVSREHAMVNLVESSTAILEKDYPNVARPGISHMPLFEDLFGKQVAENEVPLFERKNPDDILFYLHSSGSTSFPKPIAWTNLNTSQLALIPYFGERDLCGKIVSAHAVPMFHGMGFMQIAWAASCGLVVSVFEPKSPAQVPTPDGLFKAAVATNTDLIFCVPAFIEAWSNKPDCIKWLSTCDGLVYGGGALNKEVGDKMRLQGVSIFSVYGSTEGGVMSRILPAAVDTDWDYFEFSGHINAHMLPHGNDTFELILVSNEFHAPAVFNTKINGIDSYATSDLLTPHPTKPGFWRVYGRADDQITHNTGEKTNPGPLENMINQDPHVMSCVVFGSGHFQIGVIIDPKPAYKFDPSNETKLAAFRNKIWPTIQRANSFAPQHSRLFKEMIIVATPSKPFQYTAKNTTRRHATIIEYQSKIDALYQSVEASSQDDVIIPVIWDDTTTRIFARSVVLKVLTRKVEDDDDVFQHGCDSLQATWIRNTILRALHNSARIDPRQNVENFVYDHPSISRLTDFIITLTSGTVVRREDIPWRLEKVAHMHQMVERYSVDFTTSQISSVHNQNVDGKFAVLVTGTTGALGSAVLAHLVNDESIGCIYALNRPGINSSTDLWKRQEEALLDKGLNASAILNSRKVELLEGDLTLPGLGLSEAVYEKLHSVTHIIHIAWTVDFNRSLVSFEPDITGLRNLLDLSLGSHLSGGPRFIFISSIAVLQGLGKGHHNRPHAEIPVAADTAVSTGYIESKWVAEEILTKAPLSSIIVRLGQLSGAPNGSWNTKEWLPALVKSAKAVGFIPTDDSKISWIPLDVAARSLVDLLKADLDENTKTIHLVHPSPISWSMVARVFSSDLSIPLLPFLEWSSKLQEFAALTAPHQETKAQEVPVLKLLPFFHNMALNWKNMGSQMTSTTQATALSSALADAANVPLAEEDVRTWIEYWRRVEFLN